MDGRDPDSLFLSFLFGVGGKRVVHAFRLKFRKLAWICGTCEALSMNQVCVILVFSFRLCN